MIEGGNSTLLVLRKGEYHEVDVFNAVTSIAQLDGENKYNKGKESEENESVIEKNFFKKKVDNFSQMFHNGAIKVEVITNSDQVMEQAQKYKMNPKKYSDDLIPFTQELTIIFLKDPSEHSLDLVF